MTTTYAPPIEYTIVVTQAKDIVLTFPSPMFVPVSVNLPPDVARKFLATLTHVIGDAT